MASARAAESASEANASSATTTTGNWRGTLASLATTAATYTFTGLCLGLGHAAGGWVFGRVVRGKAPALPSGENVIPIGSGRKAL
jgi:hypothetical protein